MNIHATAQCPEPHNALQALKRFTESRRDDIEAYLVERFGGTQPFFYNSVDVRRSDFKVAPVDTNLFPGGFNNLTLKERSKAAELAKIFFEQYMPDAHHIVILAENHTRNRFYLENVKTLADIVRTSGRAAHITSITACDTGEQTSGETASGDMLHFEPFIAEGGTWHGKNTGIKADAILINNDLSSGMSRMLDDVRIPVTPPPGFGWYQRRKSSHFDAYGNVVREFCHHFDIDPWLMSALYRTCENIDFSKQSGIDCIALNVDKLLFKLREKYKDYGIHTEPSVFIKADNGTYGMGIMTVRSGEELHSLSRNIRKKMHTTKEGQTTSKVIIQEGVPTADRFTDTDGSDHAAESMLYLIGGHITGRILRYNTQRGAEENLNAKGMGFTPIHTPCPLTDLAARLAAYASSWECYADNYTI